MTPASTGTDGRLGRLFAVQATASASASRSTRNFMLSSASLPQVRGVGPPRTLLRRASLRVAGPAGARRREPLAAPSTPSPTPLIAFCCLRKISSRLHRGCAKCGELKLVQVNGLSTGDSQVDNQGTNPGLRPQSSTGLRLSTVVHRLSTGYPPGLFLGLCIASGRYRLVLPRTFKRKSTRFHR